MGVEYFEKGMEFVCIISEKLGEIYNMINYVCNKYYS